MPGGVFTVHVAPLSAYITEKSLPGQGLNVVENVSKEEHITPAQEASITIVQSKKSPKNTPIYLTDQQFVE